MNTEPPGQHFDAVLTPDLQRDPRLRGYFYCLPRELLKLLQTDPKLRSKLGDEQLQLEITLTTASRNLERAVGFFNGKPIQYHLLSDARFPEASELAKLFNMSVEGVEKKLQALGAKLGSANNNARAYCGWLLSNAEFVAEHQALERNGGETYTMSGFPKFVPSQISESMTPDTLATVEDQQERSWLGNVHSFYKRWQLTGMAGAFLPVPLQPHIPILSPTLSLNEFRENSTSISIPAIAPTPGDGLRSELEYLSGRKRMASHLAPWLEIVENVNRGKTHQLQSWDVRFRSVHFMRSFLERYGASTKGLKERITAVFADYLQVDPRTLKRYLGPLKHFTSMPG